MRRKRRTQTKTGIQADNAEAMCGRQREGGGRSWRQMGDGGGGGGGERVVVKMCG